MALQAPNPAEVGGAWGAGIFPPWFAEDAAARGWDYTTALNQFQSWVATGPIGPDRQPIDFGWYWNVFRPGGQFHGQPFAENPGNYTFPGQTVQNAPPQGPDPRDGQQPPQDPNQPPVPPTHQRPDPNQNPQQNPGGIQYPNNGGPRYTRNGLGPRPTQPPAGKTFNDGKYIVLGNQWTWQDNPPAAVDPNSVKDPNAPPPPPPPGTTSGPPVISYPPAAGRQPVQQAQQSTTQQPAQTLPQQGGAQAAARSNAPAFPLGGGNLAGTPPPPTRRVPAPSSGPPTPGGGAGGGGGTGQRAPQTMPPTPSAMNAQRWGKPGGLLG